MQLATTESRSSSLIGSLSLSHLSEAESFFIPMLRQRAKDFGIAELASALGKKPKVLNNELNPNSPEHKLGFDTAVSLCKLMNDHSLIRLWAQDQGLVVFEPPVQKLVDDKELISCMSLFTKEVGDVAGAIHGALEDLVITSHEVTDIQLEMTEAVESMFQLLHRIKELRQPTKRGPHYE